MLVLTDPPAKAVSWGCKEMVATSGLPTWEPPDMELRWNLVYFTAGVGYGTCTHNCHKAGQDLYYRVFVYNCTCVSSIFEFSALLC